MNLTCTQMDVLLTFYIENELSNSLKKQVEEHLNKCKSCRAKYNIIKSMITDLKESLNIDEIKEKEENSFTNKSSNSEQYKIFKTNLSAYIDNELPNEENIKIKKFTINNHMAKKDLEENYHLRKLINESMKKTESDVKSDFTKNILHKLELEDNENFGIHPAIKILIFTTISVLLITVIILSNLTV